MSYGEQVLWYVVAIRCERDINGIESVFDQLLNEHELLFLTDALVALGEPELAEAFQRAHLALHRVAFYRHPDAMCLDYGDALASEMRVVDAVLDAESGLWGLDEKLARLTDP